MNVRLNMHINGKWFTYSFDDLGDLSDVRTLVRKHVPNFHLTDDYDVHVRPSPMVEFNKEDVIGELQRTIELGPVQHDDDQQDLMARWAASLKRV